MLTFWSKLSEKLDGVTIVVGQAVLDQNNILHILINNSRTAGPTKMLIPCQTICFKLIIIFQKMLIILRWPTKHAQYLFGMQSPLKDL